ncbi:CASP-like protein 4A3 [Tanacetum coccineum]
MRGFLWCQGSLRKGKAKVSWEVVCLLKDEGGLGVRRLDHCNKALMISHVWKLLSLKESMWVRWIRAYKLKGQSFLGYSILWQHDMGMEEDPSALWCPHSSLSTVISTRDIFRAGFDLSSQVRDVIHDGMWNWPHEWTEKYPLLSNINVPAIMDDKQDCLDWRDGAGIGKPFLVQLVWNTIHPRDIKVAWFDLVWFHNCIPRHAFNMWLIIKKRLKMQDYLSSWDVLDLEPFEAFGGAEAVRFFSKFYYFMPYAH